MSDSGTAERGATGTDFSHLRPCLNGGGASGRGASGMIPTRHIKDPVPLIKKRRGLSRRGSRIQKGGGGSYRNLG